MKLPDKIFGIDTEEAYQKLMSRQDAKPDTNLAQPPSATSTQGINLADYIYMQSHNLYVAKQKSHFNKNWSQAHEELYKEKARMLIIPEFMDFINILKGGKAVDGLGNKIKEEELKTIYNEITEKKDPWRGEWLDADFKLVNEILHINYYHTFANGKPNPAKSEPLEKYVGETDCYVSLKFNKQGLPTESSKKQEYKQGENIYFYYPRSNDNSVARFRAGSDGAFLSCGRDPEDSDSSLGVRSSRAKK